MKWWDDARSVQVTSPSSGKPFKMYHYNVANSAPRPESYLAGRCFFLKNIKLYLVVDDLSN